MKDRGTKKILALLAARKMSQAELARDIGITRQHLGAILNGRYPAGKKTALKLVSWAGSEASISLADLLYLE